jgi:ADP-heptose:LPS heptosyltransferase
MHIAAFAGIPVVALFAVSDARRSGPAYDLERHTVIQKPRTCDPCLSKRCPYPLPICMENITLDEVRTAVERQFSAYTGVRYGD